MSLHFPPIDALMPRLIAKSSVASGLHALKAQDFVGPGGGVGVERGSLVDVQEVITKIVGYLGTSPVPPPKGFEVPPAGLVTAGDRRDFSKGNDGGTLANIRNVVFVVLYTDQRDSEVSVPDS